MSFLQSTYSRDEFLKFLKDDFLPDFISDIRPVHTHDKSLLKYAQKLGDSTTTSISIFEAVCDDSDHGKRVAITQDAFRVLRDTATRNALVVFYSEDSSNWRLSLLTSSFDLDNKGNVISKVSNPRRFSYLLGENAKTVTPHKYLVGKGKVSDFADLQSRFAVEVVNNDFYKEIAKLYDELVGTEKITGALKYPGHVDISHQFAVRLIGRIIFCWFLREKRSKKGTPLIPGDILSGNAAKAKNYYHSVLAPLFFEVLNKSDSSRDEIFRKGDYANIPYLNGGLFSPDTEDYYKFDKVLKLSVPGLVDVPDEWIIKFFDLLELYSFTVDENTSYDIDLSIDPEMLGRVFENLLARINPETGETVRKSTGSFYTPREIVDFMVDSSLIEYLSLATKVEKSKLGALVSYDLLDDKGNELNETEAESVLQALSTLTVLDPACGSGAFPIGMLQKIVFIISILDPDAKWWLAKQLQGATPELRREFENKGVDYIRKLGVIRQTIYGVDIQPIATEISRLRCFLTLVVDEEIDDTQENRGVKPLPNLEFKFVTANSLIKPPSENNSINTSLFEDFGSKLSDKVKEYFSALGPEKVNLLHDIRDIIDEKVDQNTSYVLNNYGLHKDDRFVDAYNKKNASVNTKLLKEAETWKSYKNIFKHKPVDFFEIKYFFPDAEDGFDIVIGNPPYYSLEKVKDPEKSIYKNTYETYSARGDLYCLFFEAGIGYTKENGILSFISSNSWLRANYGMSLRNLLKQYNPKILANFEDALIFASAIVETCVLIVNKTSVNESLSLLAANIDTSGLKTIKETLLEQGVVLNALSDDSWSIGSLDESALKSKIELSPRIKNQNLQIWRGITSGLNDAFVLDKKTRDKIVAIDQASAELIKPMLRGRDIIKNNISHEDLYIIITKFGSYKYLQKDYPGIFQHLLNFETKLKKRGQCKYGRSGINSATKDFPGQHHWLELDNNPKDGYLNAFEVEKIVWGELSNDPKFSLDTRGFYANNTVFFMTGKNLSYIVSIMNSKLAKWYFDRIATSSGMGTNRWLKYKIEQFPLATINDNNIQYIESLSKITTELLNYNTDNKEELLNKADNLVYKIYDLTAEEIQLIENSTK